MRKNVLLLTLAEKLFAIFVLYMSDWKNHIGETVEIKVTPKASFNKIKPENVEGRLVLKIYVTAAPEDGKANKAVIDMLANELKLAKQQLSILKGEHSRHKVIKIDGNN